MGFPRRLLADDETLVLVLRKHVKALFVPFVILLLVVVALAGLALVPDVGTQLWVWVPAAVVAAVVLARWVLWPFMVWRTTIHAITTRRLVLRSGVFNRQGHDMPLTRLNDVSFEHTFFERMLGCGSLVVESAGERGQLRLVDIPKVEHVQRTLYRLADELHGRRGPDQVDDDLRRDLDDAFDEEYQGPVRTRPIPRDDV